MDHRAFVQALPADVKVSLTQRADAHAIVRLIFHIGSIAAMASWVAFALPLWPLVTPPLGIMIAFLFMIEHEATHKTVLSNQAANDWIGRICGFFILLPFEWFRWFHMAHHRHTNDTEHDPEIAGRRRPDTRWAWAKHISGVPYWWAEAKVVLRLARGNAHDEFLPANAKPRAIREARIMLSLYALCALSLFFTPLVFWIWLLPVAIGQMALRIFLLSEHADCPHVADMFENTRTTFTTRLMRLITWNASYHIEHHVYPTVPFYNLPQLHERMRHELKTTSGGYANFTREFLTRKPAV
jgi:fatty acid desaturase